MSLLFSKYVGCGNDFILFDQRRSPLTSQQIAQFSLLCHRQKGIGADGVLLLEHSTQADYRMRIFNSDGQEVEMCGNGVRCLARYIHEQDPAKKRFSIQTMHQQVEVMVGEKVEVHLPTPSPAQGPLQLHIDTQQFALHLIDTGVPHAVYFCDNSQAELFAAYAPKIRSHPQFAPRGVNVNFVQLYTNEPASRLSLRTYERGVEGETLSCGTGATASALIAAQLYKLPSPIYMHTRAMETLEISFEHADSWFKNIRMSGPAVKVFHGEIKL